MPYSAATVANSILERAFREGRADMSPMKIQKLMYYVNGWQLAIHGIQAVKEPFEAWPFGPVVSGVYHQLKSYGSLCVDKYLKEFDRNENTYKSFVVRRDDKDFYEVLDLTWEKYIGISALQLSAMTHAPGSPWDEARKQSQDIISADSIRKYFVGLAKGKPN
jgi:uncharacterized phage-associated protein